MNMILHLGWCVVMPLYKLYFMVLKRCSFAQKAYCSYNTRLEGRNRIGRNSYVIASRLGFASYISQDSYLYNTNVGRYSCIGPRVAAVCGRHPVEEFVSIHPAFFSINSPVGLSYVTKQMFIEYKYADKEAKKSIVIGNDVWIGADVKIMEGVTIGDGAVIAAGALVCKDVEPYSIVAGIPAEIKRYRFDNEKIDWLLKYKWWDKPQEWLREKAESFSNIELLMKDVE